MTESQVIEKLQGVFDGLFTEKVTVTPDLTAQDVAEWDSLFHIMLVVAVEKAFAIRFQTGDVDGLKNVGGLMKLIMERLSGK